MSLFDLNMVRTFCVLYEERGVTRAADKLHLSQPTISHTLKNLRSQYRDELFVRSGRSLEPTEVAHRLYPGLKGGLAQILMASDRSAPFNPAEARVSFTLWMSDLGELAFLPRIMKAVSQQASHVRLVVEQLNVSRVEDALIRGDIDGAILTPVLESSAIKRTVVSRDEYVVIASAHHPRIGSTLSLDQFVKETHVRMDSDIGHDSPEAIADQARLHRQVVLELSRFAALPQIIEATDSLAVLPRFVAHHFTNTAQLNVHAHPLTIPPVEVSLCHLHANRQSEAQRWMSEFLRTVLQDL